MKQRKYDRSQKSKPPIMFLIVVSVLLVIIAFLIVKLCGNAPTGAQSNDALPETQAVEKNPDSIAIPGYEVLELKANSATQVLSLQNPAQNVCYFQISLYLEDGTLLWQSELIAPGDVSEPIALTKSLEPGTYRNAILKYSCFKMDGVTPLNGAETKLTLWVK